MRPGHIFDRVVAAGNVAGVLQRWGPFPAQHDSNLKDWLSEVNAETDANAKWAADGHARSAVVLSVWLDGSSVLPFQGEKVIVHLKKFVQEAHLLGFLGIQNGATPACRAWLSVFPESTTGARHWLQVQPLRLELWGLARCWSCTLPHMNGSGIMRVVSVPSAGNGYHMFLFINSMTVSRPS